MINFDDNRRVGMGMSRFGQTWWGKRWLRTLEQLGLRYPDTRLPKGRSMVRSGDVDLMHVEPGAMSTWVDQAAKSFEVTVGIPVFGDDQWEIFVRVLSAQWRNLVELSQGRLPTDVDRQLEGHGLSLFPADSELTTACICPSQSAVCVHVIAAQHAFTVWLDEDPFLLLILRGTQPDSLLERLRTAIAEQSLPPTELALEPIGDGTDFFTAGSSLAQLERVAALTPQK